MSEDLLIRLDERTQTMAEDIKEMKEKLFGNGKEGLCVMVDRHGNEILDIKESHRKLKEDMKWMLGITITAVAVIVAVLNYIKL